MEIRLDSEFPSGGKAPSNHVKKEGPKRSCIKHEELIDTVILWEGWTNKNGGQTTEGECPK